MGSAGRAPVRGVLFDYGETLASFRRPDAALGDAYAGIARHLRSRGLQPPAADVLLRDVHDRVEAEFVAHQRSGRLEEIDLVAAARRAYADVGLDLDDGVLDEVLHLEQVAWWEGVSVDPEAVPTLQALRQAGIRVGLCSNAPYRVASLQAQLEHVGLRPWLDSVTFSGATGWRKPSPLIFEAALAALGVAAADCLMVGDSETQDVAGAEAVGMRAALLRRNGAMGARDPSRAGAVIHRLGEVLGLPDVQPCL